MNTEPIRQDKSKAKIAQLLVKQDSQLLNFLIQELKGLTVHFLIILPQD